MTNDREQEIGEMWRRQPQGRQTMSLEQIRAKAMAFDTRVKRWSIGGGILLALLLVKNVWEVWVDTDVIERVSDLLLALALLYVAYWFRRHARAETAPATLGLTTCVEHYRSRLVRQRDLSTDSWKWVLPFVPGIALNVVGGLMETRSTSHMVTLVVLSVALFAGVLWVNARTARQLDRDIAALESE